MVNYLCLAAIKRLSFCEYRFYILGRYLVTAILVGINHVIKLKHIVRVTNHSYGGYITTNALEAGFKQLEDAGILAIVAAGNDSEVLLCDILLCQYMKT